MTEQWRDIPGWEGIYQASSEGRVRSLDRELPSGRWGHVTRKGCVMTPKLRDGRPVVGLRLNGKRKWMGVHRLVCLAFHGEPVGDRTYAAHYPDPTRTNNRPENLMWATPKENSGHMREHGTLLTGPKNPAWRGGAQAVAA